MAASEAAKEAGLTVALVEQPYEVAGRRSPAPAKQLDAAWIAVVEALREGPLAELPLVAGGRSAGGARGLPDGRGDEGGRGALPRSPSTHPGSRSDRARKSWTRSSVAGAA